MSFRHLFVGFALAVSTLSVAPATAQMMSSEELSAPLTRVSELSQPISNSQPQETEEQFPKVSELQEQEIEAATVIQPAQLEVVTTGTSKERSQTKSEMVEPVQPLEPSRVIPVQQTSEPSPIVEQKILEPSRVVQSKPLVQQQEPSFVVEQNVPFQPVLEPFRPVEPSRKVEPVFVQRNFEPSRVIEQNTAIVEPSQPLEPSRIEQTPKYSFNSQLKLEPFQVETTQPLEPSRVLEQETVTPPPAQNTSTKSDTQERVVPTVQFSQFNLEPSRVVPIQIQEPFPVVEQQPIAQNNVVPFNSKGRLVNQDKPSRVTQRANNIVSFNAKGRLNQVEPSQPVTQIRETVPISASPARPKPELREGQPSLALQVTLAKRTNERTQTGIALTLETPESLNRDFGTSYPGVTPETFNLDREFSIPVLETPTVRTQNNITTESRNTSVRTLSNRAIDLGGTVTVQSRLQPVVVETQQEAKPEPKPKPKGNLSVGVSGIGGQTPVLETSAGIEYDGFNFTGTLNHPLDGVGEDTVGLAATLPISDRAKLTVKADNVTRDPAISATVESKISEQLTASASFNNINRPDFNVELAGSYQISQHWSTNTSFNVTTRQLNLGATYTGKGFDATVKVDDVARNPQLGVGLGLELSSSTRLELSANNLNSNPTFAVKAIFSF
jgi:hypothetical protein